MTPSGQVNVCGSTLHGKSGLEKVNKKFLNKFHIITQLDSFKVKAVCCSDYVTIILLETGRVFQLGGTNMLDKSLVPQDMNEANGVPGLEEVRVVQIACGDYHGAAIDDEGDLYTWGGGKVS